MSFNESNNNYEKNERILNFKRIYDNWNNESMTSKIVAIESFVNFINDDISKYDDCMEYNAPFVKFSDYDPSKLLKKLGLLENSFSHEPDVMLKKVLTDDGYHYFIDIKTASFSTEKFYSKEELFFAITRQLLLCYGLLSTDFLEMNMDQSVFEVDPNMINPIVAGLFNHCSSFLKYPEGLPHHNPNQPFTNWPSEIPLYRNLITDKFDYNAIAYYQNATNVAIDTEVADMVRKAFKTNYENNFSSLIGNDLETVKEERINLCKKIYKKKLADSNNIELEINEDLEQ